MGECALELHDLDFLHGELQSFNLLAAAARATKNPVRPFKGTRGNLDSELCIRDVTCAARLASNHCALFASCSLFLASLPLLPGMYE